MLIAHPDIRLTRAPPIAAGHLNHILDVGSIMTYPFGIGMFCDLWTLFMWLMCFLFRGLLGFRTFGYSFRWVLPLVTHVVFPFFSLCPFSSYPYFNCFCFCARRGLFGGCRHDSGKWMNLSQRTCVLDDAAHIFGHDINK